jgi:hypothetical protein
MCFKDKCEVLKGEKTMAEYRCQECGATFDTQAEREQHNRMEHPEQQGERR